MAISLKAYQAGLLDNQAHAARIKLCGKIASALDETGRRLWVFGLSETEPARHTLSTTTLMAAGLTNGAILLLEQKSWYAAAALIRQLIEVEYLIYLFAQDATEPAKWLASTQAELRKVYRPIEMRRRSAGKFKDSEYWLHCALGGHPNPIAESLLPEHQHVWGSMRWMWIDLGQHLERLWGSFAEAMMFHGLNRVGTVADALDDIPEAIANLA